jgi:hypothetical protein
LVPLSPASWDFDINRQGMDIISNIATNWQQYVGILTAVLTAAVAVATVIPGDEPERTLQKIVDFISQISRK